MVPRPQGRDEGAVPSSAPSSRPSASVAVGAVGVQQIRSLEAQVEDLNEANLATLGYLDDAKQLLLITRFSSLDHLATADLDAKRAIEVTVTQDGPRFVDVMQQYDAADSGNDELTAKVLQDWDSLPVRPRRARCSR